MQTVVDESLREAAGVSWGHPQCCASTMLTVTLHAWAFFKTKIDFPGLHLENLIEFQSVQVQKLPQGHELLWIWVTRCPGNPENSHVLRSGVSATDQPEAQLAAQGLPRAQAGRCRSH